MSRVALGLIRASCCRAEAIAAVMPLPRADAPYAQVLVCAVLVVMIGSAAALWYLLGVVHGLAASGVAAIGAFVMVVMAVRTCLGAVWGHVHAHVAGGRGRSAQVCRARVHVL